MTRLDALFAQLEDRLLLAAQPVVTIDGAPDPLIGEQAHITVTFDNQPDGSPGSDVGYAPYVDLVVPQNGADGTGPGNAPPDQNDGLSFVSASYLGTSLNATVIEFDANGQAVHPFARDASGTLRVVNAADYGAAPGDQLVVLRLPYGSFVPEQPAAQIAVTLDVSPLADVGTPLQMTAVGGFAYGRDALDNPVADPPVLGVPASTTVTPQLLTLDKLFSGAENETATGPNFARSCTIHFDIAAGQQVDNVSLHDTLPDGIAILGSPILSGAPGTATYDPLTHTVSATLNGAITGVAGPEATVTINFYVADTLAPGDPAAPVLDPATGAPRGIANDVRAQADWIPADPRDDPQTVVVDRPGPEQVFTARSIATQKTQAVVVDANAAGLGPGDTLQYAIDVQISDYFDFGNLVLRDLLSDGQSYIAGSARVDVVEAGSPLGSGVFAAPHLGVSRDGGTGGTELVFNVSDQLVANGADAVLAGGQAGAGATTLRITYLASVDRYYLVPDPAGGLVAVGQGSVLSNHAAVAADIVDSAGVPTGGRPGDDTSSSAAIETGSAAKSVHAINGEIVGAGSTQIVAGDLVTFRLTYTMPQTLTAELRLTDYLPLPIFDVNSFVLTLVDDVSATIPGENVAKWGALAGGFRAQLTQPVQVLVNPAANSLTFVFDDLAPALPVSTTADILFTLRVADRPFGDGLLLTNQLATSETSTDGHIHDDVSIAQVTLTEPVLRITKGIVATDNPAGAFAPLPVGPVGFTPPGSGGVRFSGTIDSADLALAPVDSDLAGVDAGDRVTFAVIVENIGSGRNGAFDVAIGDTLPQGYRIPGSGLNLQVTDGAGNPLAWTMTGDIFTGSLQLIDPGLSQGALAPWSATGGANIVVVTYDLEVTEAAEPRNEITNLAGIGNYAAKEGGIDRVPTTTEPTEDIATTRIADPGFDKAVIATSVPQTGYSAGNPALADLTIGETVTFRLAGTLPEGRIRDLVLEDVLPILPGTLTFVDAQVASIGANLFARNPDGTPGAPVSLTGLTVSGNTARFHFDTDIINLPDNVVSDADRIVVTVRAMAADVAGNQPGALLTNNAGLVFAVGDTTASITDAAAVEIVGPRVSLVKSADVTLVQGNDVVTYTVTMSPGPAGGFTGPIFDYTLTDPLLAGQLTLVAGSAMLLTQPSGGATVSEAGGAVHVAAPVILPGEAITFSYQALVSPAVIAGSTLPNTVTGHGDSYPGTNPLGVEREFTDSATETVQVRAPAITKTVIAADTSLPETGANRFNPSIVDLAIGEEATFRITLTLPEAVTQDATLLDRLPVGAAGVLEYTGFGITRVGASISGLGPATPAAIDRDGDGVLDQVTAFLGTLTNTPDGVSNADDQIEFYVTARVRDAATNNAGDVLINRATITYDADGVILGRTATARVEIVEPALTISKTGSETAGDAGDRVSYTVSTGMPQANSGPAYDVVITDTVPADMNIDAGTLAFIGTPPPGSVLTYDPGTRVITATVPLLQPGPGRLVFTYDVIVADSVRPDQQITNVASVIYDSHPGDPGDAYQRNYGPLRDTETFTVDTLAMSKRVTHTDVPETQFAQLQPLVQDVAIGETVTYHVTVRLPEATTHLVLTDLPPRSAGYPPGAGDMVYVSSRVVSLGSNLGFAPQGGDPPTPGIGTPGIVLDPDGDGIASSITWNFGLVTNHADNVENQDDLIVVEVVLRVPDLPSNQPADRLVNTAEARYSLADGSTRVLSRSETVEIVAPELLVGKAASTTTGDAGDVVTWTVTVSHDQLVSTQTAFAVALFDDLAPGLDLIAGSVTATLAGGGPGVVTILSGNTAGDTSVRVALSQLRNQVTGPDDVLTVTYQARIAETVHHGDLLTNTAEAGWQSAPSGFPDARPDQADDDATVRVVLPAAISKTVVATSLPETGSGFYRPSNPDLAIGETATYEIRVTLGEGTQGVLVQDTLPAGLQFVSGSVISIGANISGAALGVGAAPTVSGASVTFDFGDAVIDTGDNVTDGGDVIVMHVIARAEPGQPAGALLANAARFITESGVHTATAPVDVVRPAVIIDKTASIPTGDAGDVVTFTVVLSQAAGASAPLYDLTASDTLPAGYVLVTGSASATRGAVTETGGDTVHLALPGAALLPADDPSTPAVDEARIVLTYSARLADTVEPGQVLANTASFAGVSAPGGGPATDAFAGSDTAGVTVFMPVALDKTIVATSLPETGSGAFDPALTDLAVGEAVTWRLTATLSEGTQTLVITDTLPAGLGLISAAVTGVGAGLPASLASVANTGSGQVILFDFGTVVNAGNNTQGDGTVTIEVVARVLDVPGNAAGTVLTNDAAATVTSPTDPAAPGGTLTDHDSESAEVVEPKLLLTKTAPAPFLNPGETITYTVTLSHAPGSTSAAYDIVLADLLTDPWLDLVAGSVTTTLGTVALGNGAADTAVRVDIPLLTQDAAATVTFTARVAADAPGGVTLANTATAGFDSAGGPGGRPDQVTDGTTTPGAPGLDKQIVATSNPDTGSGEFDPANPDLAIGETVTWRLTLTLPQGTASNVILSDLLPAVLQPLSARVVSVGAGLSAGAPAIGIAGQAVTVTFGTVVNASGPTIGAEDQIVIEVDAVVLDLAGIGAGTPLVNAAQAGFTIGGRDGTAGASTTADLVEPELGIVKAVDHLTGDAGDVFTYTVAIAHAAGSTAAAYDIVAIDTLDPRFVLVSAAASAGTASITGNTVRLDLPRLTLTDAPVTLIYQVRLADTVEPGQVIGNTALLGWDSNPGPGGRPGSATASADDITAVFGLDLVKTIIATSLPETGAGRLDPALPDLAVGETVTWELVVTLSEGTQRVVVTDLIPTGLAPLPGQAVAVSSGTGISAGPGGTLAPVATIAGNLVTFDFGTLVNAGDNVTGDGDRIVLQLTARVLDDPVNTNGRLAVNDAAATISAPADPSVPGGTVTASASAAAEIVLPNRALDKTVDRAGGDAGDVFTYTLTLRPVGPDDGPAYDILIEDILPGLLVAEPGSVTTSLGTATLLGNTVRVEIPVLLPDAPPVVITWRAAFADAIEPGQVVPNLATLGYTTAPDHGRPLGDTAGALVRGIFDVALDKEIIATSLPGTGSLYFDPALPDIAAGETLTWRLTATIAEGTQRLVITDTLPEGLVAEQVRVVSVGAGIAAGVPTLTLSGGRVTVDFGTVVSAGDNVADDQIVIEVVGRLNPTPGAGTVLTNDARLTVSAPSDPGAPGGTLEAGASASAEAVAAVLVFDKTSGPAAVGLGEVITYTLTLSHAAGSTAPAYEVVLFDPLSDASLQLVSGSVATSMGSIVAGNGPGDGGVRVVLPVLMPGEVLTVSFRATAAGVPAPDGTAINTATFASTSAPGDIPPGFARPLAGQDSTTVQIASGTPFAQGTLFGDFDDAFRRISRNALSVPIMLAGTAQPGAAVALGVQDSTGAPVNLIGLTADVGGHWVAGPIQTGAPGTDEVQAADGMDRLAGRQGSIVGVAEPVVTPAAPIGIAPYTILAQQAPAAFDARADMDGVRSTFAGATQPGGAFVGAAASSGFAAVAPIAAQIQRDMAGLTEPTSLAWNRFALDFAVATAAPGLAGR